MKKSISMLLALGMSLSIGATSLAAELNFSDVTKNDWFYDDIKTVVGMGLINGKSNDRYAPNDNLTYAEAIKLAACMNQFYTEGAVTLENGNPWYQPYVDYCVEKGIIDKTYNYAENATRAGYMTIFAKALPNEALEEINDIPDDSIPDVPAEKDYAAAVYKLYRAGILNGIDDAHNCEPMINISRKEVAVIVARMMNENKRTHFTIVSHDHVKIDNDTDEDTEQNETQEDIYEILGDENGAYTFFGFKSTPSDVNVDCGETATFQTEAIGGNTPFTYRWQYLNNDSWTDFEDTEYENFKVSGSTQTTLTIETSHVCKADLRCVVTDSLEEEHPTQTVKLTVNPIVSTDEWHNMETYIPNGDDSDDVADNDVDNDVDNNADDEDKKLIYENNDGIVTIQDELIIETQPSDVSVAKEKTAKFTVKVSGGTAPYNYQWQLKTSLDGKRAKWLDLNDNKNALSGTKTETLSITGSAEGVMLLRCVITDDNGNKVTTATVKLTITENEIVLPSRRHLS